MGDKIFPDWLKGWPVASKKSEEPMTTTDNAAAPTSGTVVQLTKEQFDLLLKKVQTLEARIGNSPLPDPAPQGFDRVQCRNCNKQFDADHPDPHKGGCQGVLSQGHDLFGLN